MLVVLSRYPCMTKHDHAFVHVDPLHTMTMLHVDSCEHSPVYVGPMRLNVNVAPPDQLDQSGLCNITPMLPIFWAVYGVKSN